MENNKFFIEPLSEEALNKLKEHSEVLKKLIELEPTLNEMGYKIMLHPIGEENDSE